MTPAILVILYVLGAFAILLVVRFEQRRLDRWQRGVPRQLLREQRDAQRGSKNKQPTRAECCDDKAWHRQSAA